MKFIINTLKFQEMLSKAVKGSSNNKLIPLTSLMGIKLSNNTLTITTTDMTNFLYIEATNIEGDDFNITVPTDQLYKLISKTTSDTTTLELEESTTPTNEIIYSLKVTGNGTYHIELPADENGSLIKYPDPMETNTPRNCAAKLHLADVKTILTTAKSALATTLEEPCYTNYYVSDSVTTTDTYVISNVVGSNDLFDTPTLISSEMMNLLDIMEDDIINVYDTAKDNTLVFVSSNCTVYGTTPDGIENFSIDAIMDLVNSSFESMCKISKNSLLQLLDRLSLFVGAYDNNGVTLNFTQEGIQISSKNSSGCEIIDYKESKNFVPFVATIDIEMLMNQVKAQENDVIEIWYGADRPLKLTDDKSTQIIALLDDEN